MRTTQHHRSRIVPVTLLVLATFALGACGDDDGSSSTASGTPKGHTWVTSELTANGVLAATPGGARIEITLGADGTLRARAGCNQMSGRYELKNDVLAIDDLSMTEMGCAAELMALDKTIADLLVAKPTAVLDDAGTFTVTSPSTTLALVDIETVEPTPPLIGTMWTLDTLITGNTASTLPQGLPKPITLVFGNDGRYTIDTGCNGAGGTYSRNGSKLVLEPGPTTLIGCPAPLDTLEATIGTVFSGEVTATVERQRLTVEAKNDQGLGFTAEP